MVACKKFTVLAKTKRRFLNLAKFGALKISKWFKPRTKIIVLCTLGLLVFLGLKLWQQKPFYIQDAEYIPPLVMTGGNPYIRSLMRTISESEANGDRPYNLIYSGKQVFDLSRHPNQCITIVSGPHEGECSTAAGRYQILNSTWLEKVQKYHHKPSKGASGNSYSFEPQFQDEVVYAWLNDHHTWGVNIANLLEQGKLAQVLQLLSGTWTSLGYGTENNSNTPLLSQIYQKVLIEELAQANSSFAPVRVSMPDSSN